MKAKTWVGLTKMISTTVSVRFFKFTASLMVLATLMPATAAAVTTISQGYLATDSLALGSIVSLKPNSSDHVIAASSDNANNMIGVVIDAGNSLLSLSDGQASQIQVATSGVVQVLVSDINGPINSGDEITASPISGVGMKASSNAKVIGIAQDSLSKNGSSPNTYTDKAGAKHTVQIGEVPLLVSVSYFYKQPDKTLIPPAIQNIANSLAGRTVNALPIIISAAIFLVTLIVVVSIIYSMIRSSIISVGRNPMSQSAIYRDIIQLSALVLAILAVAVIAIYMVLTKL